MKYYILPTDQDIQHHGVLGMKWGVRRYQPYSVVPRKSGQTGKELGEAKRADKIAKKNLNKAIKVGKKTIGTIGRLESKKEMKQRIINATYKNEKDLEKKSQKNDISKKYNKLNKTLEISLNKISKAEHQLGEEAINQAIRSSRLKDTKIGRNAGMLAYMESVANYYHPYNSSGYQDTINRFIENGIAGYTENINKLENKIKERRSQEKIKDKTGEATKENIQRQKDILERAERGKELAQELELEGMLRDLQKRDPEAFERLKKKNN